MQGIRQLCTIQAEPPIPFALYASKELFLAELYDMDKHLVVAVVALLLDRDASFVEEAQSILEQRDDPMNVVYDFDELFGSLSSEVDEHVLFCEGCARNWEEDGDYATAQSLSCQTTEDRIKLIRDFKARIKGRYCNDYSSHFPAVQISNHATIVPKVKALLAGHDEEDYVFLMDTVSEGNNETVVLGKGGPDFAKEVIKSI